ncbi:hypothetical protein TI04_09920 [Achromatium sp. WMS2]|nr:hypothetical protein TI04_09920 [Achromatium sp. WMS2]
MAAARTGWPQCRLIVVFQPHRYTRTRDCFEDFVQILTQADLLLLTEVYPAGEEPIAGASGKNLSQAIRAHGIIEPIFAITVSELPKLIDHVAQDGDLILILGAGDIGSMAANLPNLLFSCEGTKI